MTEEFPTIWDVTYSARVANPERQNTPNPPQTLPASLCLPAYHLPPSAFLHQPPSASLLRVVVALEGSCNLVLAIAV